MDLDKHLLGAHDLYYLTDIRPRLLQQAELFPQQAHPGVVVVPLGFEATQLGLALDDLELHRLDLVVEEGVERHGCGGRRAAGVDEDVAEEATGSVPVRGAERVVEGTGI
jgi:hypothetical protein